MSQNCGGSLWLCLPGVFNSHNSSHWVSSNLLINVQDSCPSTCSHRAFSSKASASVPCIWLLCLQSWVQWFALCPHLSHGSKNSCLFFILFIVLLVVIMAWQIPSSLHVELNIRASPFLFFICYMKLWMKIPLFTKRNKNASQSSVTYALNIVRFRNSQSA